MIFSDLIFIYISFLFLLFFLTMCTATSNRAVYTREELLALSRIRRGIKDPIPTKLKKLYHGCKAGAKRKAKRHNRRWRYKPFLLSVIMGNANSLPKKCDELEALVQNQRLYKESSFICLSESWLNNNSPDSCVDIPGFTAIWADSGKAGVLSCFLIRDGLTPEMWPLRRGYVV